MIIILAVSREVWTAKENVSWSHIGVILIIALVVAYRVGELSISISDLLSFGNFFPGERNLSTW